ncbi:hypothetical protein GWI33_006489 [Rhynchophorus ferrugineus]|uniref:Uncharacterized protein n=1 Tax=Rhynchophorus ferrugineus TaxID=354439 RepID=A0A834MCZ8_RHYFE|nr:hypothetical protein GWI33_006489 [Rhynchophorus ferrugineus]
MNRLFFLRAEFRRIFPLPGEVFGDGRRGRENEFEKLISNVGENVEESGKADRLAYELLIKRDYGRKMWAPAKDKAEVYKIPPGTLKIVTRGN